MLRGDRGGAGWIGRAAVCSRCAWCSRSPVGAWGVVVGGAWACGFVLCVFRAAWARGGMNRNARKGSRLRRLDTVRGVAGCY